MKKIFKSLLILLVSLHSICPAYDELEQLDDETKKEILKQKALIKASTEATMEAQQMMQNAQNQALQQSIQNSSISGESPFNQKLTMENRENYVNNNLSIAQTSYNNPHYQNQQYQQQNAFPSDMSEEQLLLMKQALRNKDLRAIQKKFTSKDYTGFENTLQIPYEENKTQKIRTRFTMATTLIFNTEIESYILGDSSGFRVDEIPNLQNAISIKPLLIGIDTNLTVFTKDKKIHNFYIYSTDYKSKENPNLLIKIIDKESEEIMKRLKEEEERKFLTIKEGIAQIKVEKEKMDYSYIKRAKKEYEWLLPSEVFSDDTFTYFKYEKKLNNKIPTIFAVIDKKDIPVETKIIGDYIVAESRNDKWSVWSGEAYVCIQKDKNPSKHKNSIEANKQQEIQTNNPQTQDLLPQNLMEIHKIQTRDLK